MRRILALAASVTLAVGCTPQPAGSSQGAPDARPPASAPASTDPAVRALVDSVKRGDFTAIRESQRIGAPAVASLADVARSGDAGARSLAIACLSAIGGPDTEAPIAAALLDPEEMVRVAAYQALYRTGAHRGALPALFAALERSGDARVRRTTALIIGRVEGAGAADLGRRCSGEHDASVQEGCVAARAKLGDPEARAEVERRVAATRPGVAGAPAPPERTTWLELLDYIHAPWVTRALIPLLDDRSRAVRIGGDDMPGQPEHLRVCDVAVNLAAALSGRAFSFPVDGKTNYPDAALAEARRTLAALPP